jgi:hypothetical protein
MNNNHKRKSDEGAVKDREVPVSGETQTRANEQMTTTSDGSGSDSDSVVHPEPPMAPAAAIATGTGDEDEDKVQMIDSIMEMECPVCLQTQSQENKRGGEEDDSKVGGGGNGIEMVVGECGHPVCMACIKRIVFATKPSRAQTSSRSHSSSHEEELDELALCHLPLRGRCPMCRKMLCLFDMRHTHPNSTNTVAVTVAPGRNSNTGRGHEHDGEHQPQKGRLALAFQDELDFECLQLAGSVFKISRKLQAEQVETELPWIYSLHFPPASVVVSVSEKENVNGPQPPDNKEDPPPAAPLPFIILYGDNNSEHKEYPFRVGSYYVHPKTQTFHGTLDMLRNKHQMEVWNISVQFSHGFRCICKGGIVMQSAVVAEHLRGGGGPLDGKWKVEWRNSPTMSATTFQVVHNVFTLSGVTYRFNIVEKSTCTSSSTSANDMDDDTTTRGEQNVTTVDSISFQWPNTTGATDAPPVTQRLEAIRSAQGQVVALSSMMVTTSCCSDTTTSEGDTCRSTSTLATEIGSVLTWTTSHDSPRVIQWTRLDDTPSSSSSAKTLPTSLTVPVSNKNESESESERALFTTHRIVPLSPPDGPMYVKGSSSEQETDHDHGGGDNGNGGSSQLSSFIPGAVYVPDNLWGNSFLQGNTMGMASYHFARASASSSTSTSNNRGRGRGRARGSFISYGNVTCSLTWPSLDDGQPIPSRIFFEDVSWDPDTRTFRGTINWYETHGTTWQGSYSWRYHMVFDSKFLCILTGTVWSRRRPPSSSPSSSLSYEEANQNNRSDERGGEEEEMSRFGEALNYVNAATGDHLISTLQPQSSSNSNVNVGVSVSPPGGSSESESVGARRERTARQFILEELSRLDAEGISIATAQYLRRMWLQTMETRLRRYST